MNSYDYINMVNGKPWVNRAEGPDTFDCWGLVIDSFRKLDNIELPQIGGYIDKDCKTDVAASEAIKSGQYVKCKPQDGAIMTAFVGKNLVHVGRCLGGGVIHATEGLGVRFNTYQAIAASHQHVEYFNYAPNTTS